MERMLELPMYCKVQVTLTTCVALKLARAQDIRGKVIIFY